MDTCSYCGKQQRKRTGYTWESEYYGTISIPDAEYLQCECGAEEVSSEVLKRVEEEQQRLCSKLLLQRLSSMDDINHQYMTNRELVGKLGISRQAIAKNVLVKRKIFNIVLFGQRYYLRESVDLFLRTGDGRFPLARRQEAECIEQKETLSHVSRWYSCIIKSSIENLIKDSHGLKIMQFFDVKSHPAEKFENLVSTNNATYLKTLPKWEKKRTSKIGMRP